MRGREERAGTFYARGRGLLATAGLARDRLPLQPYPHQYTAVRESRSSAEGPAFSVGAGQDLLGRCCSVRSEIATASQVVQGSTTGECFSICGIANRTCSNRSPSVRERKRIQIGGPVALCFSTTKNSAGPPPMELNNNADLFGIRPGLFTVCISVVQL